MGGDLTRCKSYVKGNGGEVSFVLLCSGFSVRVRVREFGVQCSVFGVRCSANRNGCTEPRSAHEASERSTGDRGGGAVAGYRSREVCASNASACSCAWYEERTSGPDSTWMKPLSRAMRFSAANSLGW